MTNVMFVMEMVLTSFKVNVIAQVADLMNVVFAVETVFLPVGLIVILLLMEKPVTMLLMLLNSKLELKKITVNMKIH